MVTCRSLAADVSAVVGCRRIKNASEGDGIAGFYVDNFSQGEEYLGPLRISSTNLLKSIRLNNKYK